ncbi:hypothetical protein LTS00_017671 [Friedmanniomyces endolithicus]|uniref:Protein kinase domain-containing protein n=1 Tax=Friedmanniomyces endolithicus TaxID=329885 RepID=A0AAN6F3H1_9PEZI|nr:hypothetical protein LTS00_017671 [Friedmanniomyces endolithicus]KAK0302527.1 hypothetical protein LTR82_017841 [Friedmanniomyces endolithicus]
MQRDPGRPSILSKRDLTDLCEVEDSETGTVLRTTFTFVDIHDAAWFGQVPGIRKYDLTVEDLRQNLLRVPDDTIYPEVTPGITILPDGSDVKSLFIKRPKLLCLDNPAETELLPKMLLEEAEVLEFLKSRSHKNLVRYYGCVSRRGRIIGIALEKHDVILQYRFEDDPRDLDINACIEGIRDALDKYDRPVILDYGSCRPFGKFLLSGGTPGWIDEDYDTSAPHHDEIALQKIKSWLIRNKPKCGVTDFLECGKDIPSP